MVRKKYAVVWDNNAKQSFREIYIYLKSKSNKAAIKIRDEILSAAESLAIFPERYQVDLELENMVYRSVLI